jgi:hypothetical protein
MHLTWVVLNLVMEVFFCLKFKLGIKARAVIPWAPCSSCSIRYALLHYQDSSHDARSFNSSIEILMEWYKNNFRGFRTSHCTLIFKWSQYHMGVKRDSITCEFVHNIMCDFFFLNKKNDCFWLICHNLLFIGMISPHVTFICFLNVYYFILS